MSVISCIVTFLFIQDIEAQVIADKNQYVVFNDTISLKWSNFKAKPEHNAHIGINIRAVDNYLKQKNEYIVNVYALMDKFLSCPFDRPVEDSLFCLNHELTHFKITEVCARYCRKEIKNIKKKRIKAVRKQVKKFVLKYDEMMRQLHAQYDQETNHSIIRWKQSEWDDLVNKWLNDLNDFSSTQITIHLK